MREKWSPLSLTLLSIYASCFAIVLPQTYLISYLAFGSTHLALRGLTKWLAKRQERKRLLDIFSQ